MAVAEAVHEPPEGHAGVPLVVGSQDALTGGGEARRDVVIAPEDFPFEARVLCRKRPACFLQVIEPWLGIEDWRCRLGDLGTIRIGGTKRGARRRKEKSEPSCLTRLRRHSVHC